MRCLLCQTREAERPQCCEPCRLWLPTVLRDLVEGYALLSVVEVIPASFDPREGWRDPVALGLPAGTVRSGAGGAPVTGTHEAPEPVLLDVVDLTAAARQPNPARGPGYYPRSLWPEDQIGQQPVATILDQWVRDWVDTRGLGEHLPVPTVVSLGNWLAARLDWACDSHPAIDEFAGELRSLRSTLRTITLGRREVPELCDGVVCSGCDMRQTCYRHPGSQWRAECGSCGKLWTDEEWAEWVGLLAASARRAA